MDRCSVFIIPLAVEYGDVLDDPPGIGCARQGDDATLPDGDCREQRIGQDAADCHAAIAGDGEPGFAGRLDQRRLIQIGMVFELVGDE